MEYRIIKKPAFTVIGSGKVFKNEAGSAECPKFWAEHYEKGNGRYISGMYGICLDGLEDGTFRYMIADDYDPAQKLPEEFETAMIPENTWAVFPCKGPMPQALQAINGQVFSQWLPTNREYALNGMCCIEYYSDSALYPKGNLDEDYYCELWIPVRAKQ